MFKVWLTLFMRNSRKNGIHTFINILGLTLGLAGLLLVLLYMADEKRYNQWNPYKNDIYRVANIKPDNGIWYTSTAGQMIYYEKDIPEVLETIMISPFYRGRVLSNDTQHYFTEKLTFTEPNFFNFFPLDILEGSIDNFSTTRKHIAISEKVANALFANESAVGRMLTMDEKQYTVACVYKTPTKNHYESEVLVPFATPFEEHWGNYQNELFCKIQPGTAIDELEKKMDRVLLERNIKPELDKMGLSIEEGRSRYGFMTTGLERLADIRLHHIADYAGPSGKGNYELLITLLGLSVLLIVISCVNFINLSTAASSQRAKEVGVKKTLGLSKLQLQFQYVWEILVQGMLAFLIALVLVELSLPYVNDFLQKELSLFDEAIALTVWGITLVLSVFIGSIPAIYLSNFKAVEVLKGNYARSRRGRTLRHAMLGLQFVISGFFLIGVLVIYQQMSFIITKDLGYQKEQIIDVSVFNINDEYEKYQRIKAALASHPGVADISTCMLVPGEGNMNGTALRYKEEGFNAGANSIDFNYVQFAGLNMVKGRELSEKFASDTIQNLLINETAAKRLGIAEDPIGKRVSLGWIDEGDDRKLTVVGVVKDYHFDGLDKKIDPMFFVHPNTFPFTKNWIHSIQFKLKTTPNMEETIADIERFWKENIDNKYPFSYEFLDKKFEKTYEKYKRQQVMFFVLSSIVILMALLGLFALATLNIQQRLREVAIRKTLGASVREIMTQLLKSFIKVTVIASFIMLPIAYYFMQNWLDNFVYRIDMPWWPYMATPVILVILVGLVVGGKAYKATKINLINYLKFE